VDHGEPYTAGRLLTDLLPLLDRDLRARSPSALRQALMLGAETSASAAATLGLTPRLN